MKIKKIFKIFVGFIGVSVVALSFWLITENSFKTTNSENQATNTALKNEMIFTSDTKTSETGITLEELSAFNGEQGEPAYIAVEGVVYDVSNSDEWKSGSHYGLTAGQDLTQAFLKSPHSTSILKSARVVGYLHDKSDLADASIPTPEQVEMIESETEENTEVTVGAAADVVSSASVSQSTVFNKETLKKYDGKNGNLVYIAIEGIVYDVSRLEPWRSGSHAGYPGGKDLTEAFSNSPHSASILASAKEVGVYSNDSVASNSKASDSTDAYTQSQAMANTTENVLSETWTYDNLASYDGQKGRPAYIAVNNTIYDVTYLGSWSDGTHKGYRAGSDLTKAFEGSPHSQDILKNAILVGQIGDVMIDQTQQIDVISSASQKYEDDDDDDDDDDDYYDDDDDEDEDEDDDDDDDDEDDDEDEDDD